MSKGIALFRASMKYPDRYARDRVKKIAEWIRSGKGRSPFFIETYDKEWRTGIAQGKSAILDDEYRRTANQAIFREPKIAVGAAVDALASMTATTEEVASGKTLDFDEERKLTIAAGAIFGFERIGAAKFYGKHLEKELVRRGVEKGRAKTLASTATKLGMRSQRPPQHTDKVLGRGSVMVSRDIDQQTATVNELISAAPIDAKEADAVQEWLDTTTDFFAIPDNVKDAVAKAEAADPGSMTLARELARSRHELKRKEAIWTDTINTLSKDQVSLYQAREELNAALSNLIKGNKSISTFFQKTPHAINALEDILLRSKSRQSVSQDSLINEDAAIKAAATLHYIVRKNKFKTMSMEMRFLNHAFKPKDTYERSNLKKIVDHLKKAGDDRVKSDLRMIYRSRDTALGRPASIGKQEPSSAINTMLTKVSDFMREKLKGKEQFAPLRPVEYTPLQPYSQHFPSLLKMRDKLRTAGNMPVSASQTEARVESPEYLEAIEQAAVALDLAPSAVEDLVQLNARKREKYIKTLNDFVRGVPGYEAVSIGKGQPRPTISSADIQNKPVEDIIDRIAAVELSQEANEGDIAFQDTDQWVSALTYKHAGTLEKPIADMIEDRKAEIREKYGVIPAQDQSQTPKDMRNFYRTTAPAVQLNAEFFDFVIELGELHAQIGGGTMGPAQSPFGVARKLYEGALSKLFDEYKRAQTRNDTTGANYISGLINDALDRIPLGMQPTLGKEMLGPRGEFEAPFLMQAALLDLAYATMAGSSKVTQRKSIVREHSNETPSVHFATVLDMGLSSQGMTFDDWTETANKDGAIDQMLKNTERAVTQGKAIEMRPYIMPVTDASETGKIYLAETQLSADEHAEIRAYVDLMAPNLRVRLVETITNVVMNNYQPTALGQYTRTGIRATVDVASREAETDEKTRKHRFEVVRHEVMHALLAAGYFSEQEVKELVDLAKRNNMMQVEELIAEYPESAHAEESVAFMFGYYSPEFSDMGIYKEGDPIAIFEKVLSGEIARRGAGYGPLLEQDADLSKLKRLKGKDLSTWNRIAGRANRYWENLVQMTGRLAQRYANAIEDPVSIRSQDPEGAGDIETNVAEEADAASMAVMTEPEAEAMASSKRLIPRKKKAEKKPKDSKSLMSFDNPEVEHRFQNARGATPVPTAMDKFLEGVKLSWRRATRAMPSIKESTYNADFVEGLRKVEASTNVGQAKIVEMFRKTMDGLDEQGVEFMTRAIMLKDLYWTAEQNMALPYGFKDLDDVAAELEKANAIIAANPDFLKRIEARQKGLEDLRKDLISSGVLTAKELKNTDYFRHKVIEYAQLKNLGMGNDKLQSPIWKRRDGSEKDISANYFEVEAEMLMKSYRDIAVSRFLKDVLRKKYDKMPEYRARGKAANELNLSKTLAEEMSEGLPDHWKTDEVIQLIAEAASKPVKVGDIVTRLHKALADFAKERTLDAVEGYEQAVNAVIPDIRREMDAMDADTINQGYDEFASRLADTVTNNYTGISDEAIKAEIERLSEIYPEGARKDFKRLANIFWMQRERITKPQIKGTVEAFQDKVDLATAKASNPRTASEFVDAFADFREQLPDDFQKFFDDEYLRSVWDRELDRYEILDERAINKAVKSVTATMHFHATDMILRDSMERTPHLTAMNEYRRAIGQSVAIMKKELRNLADEDIANMPAAFRDPVWAYKYMDDNALEDVDLMKLAQWSLNSEHEKLAMPAGSMMKAIALRRVYVKTKLMPDKFIETKSPHKLIDAFGSETDSIWQPDAKSGNERAMHMFNAKTVPERMVDVLTDQLVKYYQSPLNENQQPTGKIDPVAMQSVLGSVKNVMARGGAKEQLIIGKDMSEALNSLRDPVIENGILKMAQFATRQWKIWTLLNPTRVMKYTLNNITSDIDALLGMQPGVFREMKASFKLLRQVQKGQPHDPILLEAIERGVLQSGLTEQEIDQIGAMRMDDSGRIQLVGKSAAEKAATPLISYLERVRRIVMFRENHTRLAAYIYYRRRFVDEGATVEDVGYGATKPWVAKGITDKQDLAARMARDVMGDYGAISYTGRRVRHLAIPFWSWMESNTRRYVNRFRNAYLYGRDVSASKGLAMGAATSARMLGQLFIFWGAVQVWNHLFFGDDEEELTPSVRSRLHLNMGRREDGSLRTLRFQGSLSDFLSWFGMEDAGAALTEVVAGRAGIEDIATSMAKAPVNKMVSGLNPSLTAPIQMALGKEFYPDLFRPRLMWDPVGYGMRTFSLGGVYSDVAVALGKPVARRDRWTRTKGLLMYHVDPGETAWSAIRSKAYSYAQKELGKETSGIVTHKSAVVREWRRAILYGDTKVENMAYDKMRSDFDMSRGDIRSSMKRAAPLAMLTSRERRAFKATLTPAELRQLEIAENWYKKTFRGANFGRRKKAA